MRGPVRTALALALALACATPQAAAETLDLSFLPPLAEPSEICRPPEPETSARTGEAVDVAALTDGQRIRFLRRDIRNLQAEDADRWFDFVTLLIDRLVEIDGTFDAVDGLLARVELHVNAGRLPQLTVAGIVPRLYERRAELGGGQLVALAHHYIDGIGVPADAALGQDLLREAAYAGNPDALLEIARLQLAGALVEEWTAPLDLTVTMALGGMLGPFDEQICGRAERIARMFDAGIVVAPNPDLALAWYTFAADHGGAEAAWRVVDHHLRADPGTRDDGRILHYLQLAVERGFWIENAEIERLKTAADVDTETLRRILGRDRDPDARRTRPSLLHHLHLSVNIAAEEVSTDSPFYHYLRELAELPEAPGLVFRRLAEEVLARAGRWAGEAEAIAYLDEAARRGDADGMRLLAKHLVRFRDDPAQIDRAAALLSEAVSRFGMVEAMADLDTLHRCQRNDAPRLREAERWARAFRAALEEPVEISAPDLVALSPYRAPETLAQIQAQALEGRPQDMANYLQYLQISPQATDRAQRMWAGRVARSAQALEAFAELELDLATSAAEREMAIEFFRRVYLNNGATTGLDLAVALIEFDGRDPEVAALVLDALTRAGNRGEGAAIRLKARLLAHEMPERAIFEEFADAIEARGDFLALMFAIPHVSGDKVDDYIDRAVSLMNCTTKDADELGEAYARMEQPQLSYHWRRIGLTFEGGNSLSRLRLTNRQTDAFGTGSAPDARAVLERTLGQGERQAVYQLYELAADPDLETFDPARAAEHFLDVVVADRPGDVHWLLARYRAADPAVREILTARIDIEPLLRQAAGGGDPAAGYEYAMLLRDTARAAADLEASAEWLRRAAQAGSVAAMSEYGHVLSFGIGVPRDPFEAASWLSRAAGLGSDEAARRLHLLKLQTGPGQ